MLVLSRKKHEAVWIGDHIRVSIVEVRGDTVRIGFDAPDNVVILREEIRPTSLSTVVAKVLEEKDTTE